jgi:mannose-6-phosphate isomerase-like protein (cupin superfamily)
MKILRSGQWTDRSQPSFEVEGREHGVELSVIVEDMPAGRGPRLHKHPYGEAWVVCSGKAEFSDGTKTEAVGTGDVIFVGPESPHKFRSIGDEPLKMVCVHGAGKFSTQWLEQ